MQLDSHAEPPPYKLVDLFRDHGKLIFPQPRWVGEHKLRMGLGLGKYSQSPLIDAIRTALPEKWNQPIETLDNNLAIVSLSRVTQRHRLFASKSYSPTLKPRIPLYLAILASAAAPTYFPEVQIDDDRLVDGGLVANAPVLLATELAVRHRRVDPRNIRLLHIGTAGQNTPEDVAQPSSIAKRVASFTQGLVTLTLSAQEKLAVDIAKAWMPQHYVNIDSPPNANFHVSLSELDNASDEAIGQLLRCADEAWHYWMDDPRFRYFFPRGHPVKRAS